VSPLFRRAPTDPAPAPVDPAAPAKEGGKGRPTPKRREAQAGRKLVEAPPANRKEAMRRMRERQREERVESREGMMRGDERYLLPRDRGPVRALVRDIVDSRRNVGTWFLAGAFVVLIGGSIPIPAVRSGANAVWLLLVLALVVDGLVLARGIRRAVGARFPEHKKFGGLYLYGVLRSTVFRRMRTPRPRVDVGQSL
jgi:hypothetical protein